MIYVYCFLCCPHGAKNWLTSRECKYYVYCLIVYPDILFWWHLHCILKSFGLVTAFLQMGSQFKSSHWHQYDSGWNLLIRCDSSNCAVNMIFIWVDFLLVLYLSQHHLFISTAFNHRIKTLSEYLLNDCHDRVFFFFLKWYYKVFPFTNGNCNWIRLNKKEKEKVQTTCVPINTLRIKCQQYGHVEKK